MAQIEERRGIGRTITVIYLFPLFYIVNTSFRPWKEIKADPPKLLYDPSIGSFIRIFTARTIYPPGEMPIEEGLEEMKWYERIVYNETNEQIVRQGDLTKRYFNSLFITLTSTLITVVLGTTAAYGFSRFPVKGKDDLLFSSSVPGCSRRNDSVPSPGDDFHCPASKPPGPGNIVRRGEKIDRREYGFFYGGHAFRNHRSLSASLLPTLPAWVYHPFLPAHWGISLQSILSSS